MQGHTNIRQPKRHLVFDDGKHSSHERLTIRGTAEHPFYVQGKGWTPLGELRESDQLVSASGEIPIVTSKAHHPETVEVYNFEVEQAQRDGIGAVHGSRKFQLCLR